MRSHVNPRLALVVLSSAVVLGLACGPPPCVPECGALKCGPDPKCSTSCGSCGQNEACLLGQCQSTVCTPNCTGRVCGPDPVCGSSCGTCPGDAACQAGACVTSPPTCSPPSTTGTCSVAGSLWCGSSACCAAGYPYHCASTGLCYASQAGGVAACGAACTHCGASTGTCATAPTGGSCSTAGYLFCGSGTCCSPSYPYFCPGGSSCYATQAGASAACPGACVRCTTSSSGYRCGGTGDSCPSASCCGGRTGTLCCKPPFCAGDCVGSPCC